MTATLMLVASSLAMSQPRPAPETAATPDAPQFMDMGLYCPVQPGLDQIGLDLGNLPNDANGSVPSSYQLPRGIAEDAAWVQVFTWIMSGNSRPSIERIYRFTSEWRSYAPVHYYLYSHGYPQAAVSYNSDNFWLPVPASGQIQVSRTGPRWEDHWNSSVRITGYLRKHRGLRCRFGS
jgi:hypothetical protein